MAFITTFLGGLAGAAIVALVAGLIGFALSGSGTASAMEQAVAAAYVFAPIGALAGLIAGVWLVLRRRGEQSFAGVLGHSALIVLTIAAIGGGGALLMQNTSDVLRPNQAPLQL